MPPALRVLALAIPLLAACSARPGLHRVVLDYDETVSRAQAEMLLLNVARARHRRPLHFTTVTGIAATFDFQASAGLGAELANRSAPDLLMPSLGLSASENPTISIVPIQGEEFTRRLLEPLDESTLAFFYHQGIDPELLLRLVAHGVVVEVDGQRRLHRNDPSGSNAGFEEFLERVATAARAGRLDVGPLVFEERWPVDGEPPSAAELAGLIEQGYAYRPRSASGGATLGRRVIGRQILTDYDPATLSEQDRASHQSRAQAYPASFVLVDLRGDSANPQALRAWIKLRSLSAVVDATARATRAIGAADPSSSKARPALAVVESGQPIASALFSVDYEGLSYAVLDDPEHRSPTAFRVLYRLYQMAVAGHHGAAVPPVTIAK